jgi:hypothetical protein
MLKGFMRSYLGVLLYHLWQLQEWAEKKDAQLNLDIKTFNLEVKYRGRYYTMYPTFQEKINDRLVYVTTMPRSSSFFGGWRPYRVVTHTHSISKIPFKKFLCEENIRTPRYIENFDSATELEFDYILKNSKGSFGYQIDGPFRRQQLIDRAKVQYKNQSENIFIEQFIEGHIVKIWFWGSRPFYAQLFDFPTITGDGHSTANELLLKRLNQCGIDWGDYSEKEIVIECLKFQNFELHDVIDVDRSLWFDYRYGRNYQLYQGITPESDSVLSDLIEKTGNQISTMGVTLAKLLMREIPLPILVSVDAMLDSNENLWWLEMNTNPVVPPECYQVMFSDLFS